MHKCFFRRHIFEKPVRPGTQPGGSGNSGERWLTRDQLGAALGYALTVLEFQYDAIGTCGKLRGILRPMSRIVRSAMLQMRVAPEIKYASEHVLRRLGLNLTEAMELFLRQMIIEQRLPFNVVAFDNAAYTNLILDWEEESRTISMKRDRRTSKSTRISRPVKRE